MSFIANIAYQRPAPGPAQYERIGKLWFSGDGERRNCSLLLHGWRQGQCFAKPFEESDDLPYLNGDIMVKTGEYEKDSMVKKQYLKCGFVWTESNQEGCIYQIRLEVDPAPVLIHKQIEEYERCRNKGIEFKVKSGLFVSVHLTD